MFKNKKSGELHAQTKRGAAAQLLRRLTITAVFVAMGVAVKSVTKLPLAAFGAGGMQIHFSGIFTFFPAALFGPIYGGIASALSDLLGCIIAPTGAYIPWLTVTAFLGGFLKGLIWKWVTGDTLRRIRLPLVALFLCIGLLGGAFGLSLINDGVLPKGTLVSEKTELPLRYEVDQMESEGKLSPLSLLATRLAQYNKDTYTLTSLPTDAVSEDGTLYLPSEIYDAATGQSVLPTKVAQDLFDDYADLKTIVSRKGYKNLTAPDGVEIVQAELLESMTGSTEDGYGYSSSDTYRKYLSGYINFAYAGLLFISVLGLLFIGFNVLLERINPNRSRATQYLRIALALVLSGSVVTTINTFILRAYTAAWTGRVFLFLWIPRICEEWIVCLVQAYVIALLYGMLTSGRLRPLFDKVGNAMK